MGSLSNGRPYIREHSGVMTMPEYSEYSAVTFAVVANAVRLQVTGITETQLKALVDKYILADNGAETSQVRLVNEIQIVDGTPDTYFVVINEPFTVAAASYDLLYVDPINAQFVNTVIAGTEDVYVDGEAVVLAGEAVTFEPAEPYRPLVLFSDYPYRLSNGFFFDLGNSANAATTPEIVESINLIDQSAAIAATVLFPVTETGFYQVGWNASVTRAATNSSKLGDFAVKYNDPSDSVDKTTGNQNNVTASTGNTTANCISGTYTIYAKAGTDISYIMGYTSVGATAMVYSLNIILIKL